MRGAIHSRLLRALLVLATCHASGCLADFPIELLEDEDGGTNRLDGGQRDAGQRDAAVQDGSPQDAALDAAVDDARVSDAMTDATVIPDAMGPDGAVDAATGLPLGDPCSLNDQCQSTHCSEGVCCQTACMGNCERCDLSSNLGACTAVPIGQPPAPGGTKACASDGTLCGPIGTCDGQRNCAVAVGGTPCGTIAGCSGPNRRLSGFCDGLGLCIDAGSYSCAPYDCATATGACVTTCQRSSDCAGSATCDVPSGQCDPNSGPPVAAPPGSPCSAAGDCASNICSDGSCCQTNCPATCQSCGIPGSEGACLNVPSRLPPTSPKQCASGMCNGVGQCSP